MKATLKISNNPTEGKKLYVAARINNVKLGNRTSIGNDQSLLEVDFRNPSDLYEMGKLSQTVTGHEFDEQLKVELAKAKAKVEAAK